MFLTESWFWRGTQSAIFYYVSCSPCLEQKYKRTRRKDAERAYKEKSEIITNQPGRVQQPGPFETNPDWTEEIIRGPGPPKGWKKEKILQGYTESARERYRNQTEARRLPSWSPFSGEPLTETPETPKMTFASVPVDATDNPLSITVPDAAARSALEPGEAGQLSLTETLSPISKLQSNLSMDTTSSDQPDQQSKARPSMDRRLSSAVENIKDTIKGWNLKRYEREDEILSGLNERLIRMWDKAIKYGTDPAIDSKKAAFPYGRKRAGTTGTNESDRHDWERAVRNPEINEMHPPTVPKLPVTRDEAAWMLLPPPSAAVMAGRVRPQAESPLRWPLAQIGRNQDEWEQMEIARQMEQLCVPKSTRSAGDSERIPDLSNSSSDEAWSDDEDEDGLHGEDHKRHSAPVDGWMPVFPKAVAHVTPQPSRVWRGSEPWGTPHVF